MALLGYDDTPILPYGKYRVHDSTRPQPRVITPAGPSTQEAPGTPPSDAVVLFDGKDLWLICQDGRCCRVEGGERLHGGGAGHRQHPNQEEFGDCQLHIEWAAPVVVKGESQGRGNSGVFLMGRYEIQVLDCYNNPTYADGTAAGIYGQYPPLVNASRKPGEWQTYDIIWEAPRFADGKIARPARVTVIWNGVVVHNATKLIGPTTHRQVLPWAEHPPVGPLELQDHGDLVRYRNIWYRPLKDYDE